MSEWQPIETAPTLEFVISDAGNLICETVFGRYLIQQSGARFTCTYPKLVCNNTSIHEWEESALEAANNRHRQAILKALTAQDKADG